MVDKRYVEVLGEAYQEEAMRNVANACCTHLRAVVKHLTILLEEDCARKDDIVEYRKNAFTLMGQLGTLAEECSKCSVKRTEK